MFNVFFVIKMQQNLVFVVVGSICVAFFSYCQALRDVVFIQKPQNLTIFNLKEPFFLNCSTDVASNEGMDWMVRISGILERICSSKDFHDTGSNSCQLNYFMEVPNNRTLNLIVDPQIARLGTEYCCQFDNGAGKKSCSYLTISLATDPAFTDSTTKVFSHKNTTASEESPANGGISTGLIVGIVVGILAVFGIVGIILAIGIIFRNRRKHRESTDRTSGDPMSTMSLTT